MQTPYVTSRFLRIGYKWAKSARAGPGWTVDGFWVGLGQVEFWLGPAFFGLCTSLGQFLKSAAV